jgi:lipopolysaccharide heptosyltransferase III
MHPLGSRPRYGVAGAGRTLRVGDGRSPRVLFIRPDHIGDLLLTLPAVAALRRVLPGAYLAYAAPLGSASVPRHCPDIDETVVVRFPSVSDDSDAGAWREALGGHAAKLAATFDAALVVRPDDPWSGELVAAASIPVRIGFDMPRTRPFLTDRLPVPRTQHVGLDPFDLADALLARLGIAARTTRILASSFAPSPEDEAEASRVLAGAAVGGRPIVLHPGSGWPLKNWPARRWRRVAAELARRWRTRPLVAGTAAEQALAGEVAERTPAANVAGRLSLGALAAVHRRARVVVTTDSGALHLAAAMGAPAVALFGPGDPVRFAPFAPPERIRVVRVGLQCSPCGTLEHPPCGAAVDPDCVTGIAVDRVLSAAEELLA